MSTSQAGSANRQLPAENVAATICHLVVGLASSVGPSDTLGGGDDGLLNGVARGGRGMVSPLVVLLMMAANMMFSNYDNRERIMMAAASVMWW